MSIPITVLCGFLGSGKTTLLRRWKREESLNHAAFIIHDLSEFGLDAELVGGDESTPVAGQMNDRVAALHGRHAREELHESLGKTLLEASLLQPCPPIVLVESTGAAHPWPLIEALTQNDHFHLRHFIVTVDALSLHRDFADGALLGVQEHEDAALQAAVAILIEQVCFASVLVLTKIDTIPKSSIDIIVRHLQRLNSRAVVALSAQAGLQLVQLDGVAAPSMPSLQNLANTLRLDAPQSPATADGVDCQIFKAKRPFHPDRLMDCCRTHLATGLYRTKGFLWLASRPGHVLLWQQAGSQISLEFTGLWRAELLLDREKKLFPEEIQFLKKRMETEDPIFGDRHIELTLIGQQEPREAFANNLRACLCTDQEIEAWQNGEDFADPWPTTFVRT